MNQTPIPPPYYDGSAQPPPQYQSTVPEQVPYDTKPSFQATSDTKNIAEGTSHDSIPPQQLHFLKDRLLGADVRVAYGDENTTIYCSSVGEWKGNITVYRGASTKDTLVSTIKHHSLHPSTLNFNLTSQTSTLASDSNWKIRFKTTNPVDGLTYTWKTTRENVRKMSEGNLKLVDKDDNVIARFLDMPIISKKNGKLEVLIPMGWEMMDWLIATAIIMLEKHRQYMLTILVS